MVRIKKREDAVDCSRRQRSHGMYGWSWGDFIMEEAWYIYQSMM